MRNSEVKYYYNLLKKKKVSLLLKRIIDIIGGIILLILFSIPLIVIAIIIKLDSDGPIFYRQERVTSYGKIFHIHKFRTMINEADKYGTSVTLKNDDRITKVGIKLREYRLDELPQIFDLIYGNMSFVGTRPEITKYVNQYKPEYMATLLLPAGITSETSIRFKDESTFLESSDNVDEVYINDILPVKMKYNLKSIENFSILTDMITIYRTIMAVFGKKYN
ncbi:sugar transferase [Anaerococcus sp. NML200574]|uniref:sugar transferase n=1 Tax=Anaerococcus sp. NML200574 TaxID=2954486 RepID=UPI002AA29E05|nr:sugar transferase [Anaerococcus sp. NML200574]